MEQHRNDSDRSAYIDLLKRVLTASIYDESAWRVVSPAIAPSSGKPGVLKGLIEYTLGLALGVLRRRSLILVKRLPYVASEREEGRDWPMFGYTMIGHRRLDNVQHCVERVLTEQVPGDFIEAGAWRGGTTIFMRALLKVHGVTDRKVWVADSFQGLPPPKGKKDGWDLSRVELLKVSLEQVKSNFERFGLLDDQVAFLKGWFSDTLPNAPIERIAILRLDGDLYHSTMDTLDHLYAKVSQGGYVIVDDYHSWPSCRQAVTDFLRKHEQNPEMHRIDWAGVYWQVN